MYQRGRAWVRALYLLLPMLLLLACRSDAERIPLAFIQTNGQRTQEITAEIAATPGARTLGLMYRKTMGSSEGMLFVFPEESLRSFWMKNTYLALDIVYIGENFEVVSIVENATPLTETPRPSGKPAQYVVELNGGRAKELGITPGAKLELPRLVSARR